MKILDIPKSILDLLAAAQAPSEWGAPEALLHPLAPVPVFDEALLPDAIRAWVVDVAHRMQCAIEYAACAVIVMISSVIGSACAVRPKQNDNWAEVPNLWGLVVGEPGDMKTPAVTSAFGPLRELVREAERDFEAEVSRHLIEETRRKHLANLMRTQHNKMKTGLPPEDEIDALAKLSEEPKRPIRRRYMTNDATIEKLGEICRDNPRGVLCYRDELAGLFMSFERAGHESDRHFFLEAWTGKHPYHVDRIGRGEVHVDRLCLSVFGTIQPEPLARYVHATQIDGGGNDGFVQRFQIAVFPDRKPFATVIDERPDEGAYARATEVVAALAGADFTTWGASKENENEIPYLRFERCKAYPLFVKWMTALRNRIDNEESGMMREHLAKYLKLVPALALIFYLLKLADTRRADVSARVRPRTRRTTPAITKDCLELAINWAVLLEAHARRIYGLGGDIQVQAARALARKIVTGDLIDGFNTREIGKKNWSGLADPDLIKAACDELELANWIRRREVERIGATGRPPLPAYDINPGVRRDLIAGSAPAKPAKHRRRR